MLASRPEAPMITLHLAPMSRSLRVRWLQRAAE